MATGLLSQRKGVSELARVSSPRKMQARARGREHGSGRKQDFSLQVRGKETHPEAGRGRENFLMGSSPWVPGRIWINREGRGHEGLGTSVDKSK